MGQRIKRIKRGNKLKLSFLENKFVIQNAVKDEAVLNLLRNAWHSIDSQTFTTRNIKQAARFRSVADNRAERIFNKLMLKSLPIPPGGPICPSHMTLMPFQIEKGIPHILKSNKSYLAHQPGLGKSAQSICAVNTKPGKTLIIVPSFLKMTWVREITKWFIKDFPEIEIVPETEKRFETNWGADFIICSDAMISKSWVLNSLYLQKFRYIFIDEGHRFKTPNAARTIALFGGRSGKFKSPGLIYNSEHVSILSGTPLLNRPIELWPVLFAMAPELIDFMSYEDFGFRYGGAIQDERGHWRFIGSANEAELNKKIMGRFMQYIKKKDVLKDLPDKIREVILIDRDTRKEDVKSLDQYTLKKIDLDNLNSLGDYAKVRHENGLAKVAWAAAFVTNILSFDNEEQIILFAHHRDVVEKLKKELEVFQPLVINGGVKEDERTKIEDLFQSGQCRLIIGNIDSMNLGITLTKAKRVVFAEYSWTPALNEQAEDRAHRIGQKDSVFCQYLVYPNSIDELILNAILTKQEKIGKVLA